MQVLIRALALSIALVACSDSRATDAVKSSARPNSGSFVEIPFDAPVVVTSAAAVDSVPVLRPGPTPITVIHASETDPNYDFYNTREVIRLDDGTIVVATAGTLLRFYDRAGRFIRSVGRKGDGPGEFRAIHSLQHIRGDSIATFDLEQNRVSIFDPNGNFARSWSLPVRGGFTRPGIIDDGTVLLAQEVWGERQGKFRVPLYAVLVAPAAQRGDTLVSFHGPWMFFGNNSGGSIPFTPAPDLVAGNSRFYLTSADSYDVMVFEGSRPLHRIRNTQPLRKVTREDLDRYASAQFEFDTSAAYKRFRDAVTGQSVQYHPAIRGLIAGPQETIWVATRVRSEDKFLTYHIYDRDGRLTASLQWFYENGGIRNVGSDYVIVARYGEMAIDRIEVLPLITP